MSLMTLFLADTYAKCELDLQNFINLCKEIGVPLAPDKTVAPCRVIEFLGITLDAEQMEARLPQDKLAKGRALLEEFLTKEKVTLRELQSLIGVLNFACTVVIYMFGGPVDADGAVVRVVGAVVAEIVRHRAMALVTGDFTPLFLMGLR